jgi:phosphopantothenoylcysteine decarboxylase/phosphopantothenate--cysteine ligase
MLKDKKIVIGITGSIAAYKVPYLVRMLKKEGADVQVMMTPAALDFVTPLTLSTLSGRPVMVDPFDPDTGEWTSHVDLGLWADLFILAPLSANTMAKMAQGVADNFFLTAYLSAKCPVMFAPAMDRDMYLHPATQQNVETLQSYGNILIPPATGELASGLCGEGRMEEPESILGQVKSFFLSREQYKGKTILVSAGPTYEPIDPVRFIGNHSSGKMGYAIASEFAERGARVLLVSGPTELEMLHPHVDRIGVMTADEMHQNCTNLFPQCDIAVMTAAVADYTPKETRVSKIKKKDKELILELRETKDILLEMGKAKKKNQVLVGFALETDDELGNARAKLAKKNLDLVIMNSLNEPGAGFRHDTNKITMIEPDGTIQEFPVKSKREVAKDIVDRIWKLSDK